MKDVASRAGVGLSTVSRVVSGVGGVSPAKERAVLQAIRALGYTRNDFARQLRMGTTSSIGMLVTELSDPFFATMVHAVEATAAGRDSLLLAASATDDPKRATRVLEQFAGRRMDGMIIVSPEAGDLSPLLRELDAGTPVVFVDRPPIGLVADEVLIDNEAGAESAVRHLIAHGHREIACIAHVSGEFTSAARRTGHERALRDAGISPDPRLVAAIEDTVPASVAALRTMLELEHPPTAVFATNRRTTLVVLQAMRTLGVRLAFVGFDDFEFSTLTAVPTTVVAQDPQGTGHAAAGMLFDRLSGYRGPTRRFVLETRLIVRGSGEIPPPSITT